jgi:hypothetical protein
MIDRYGCARKIGGREREGISLYNEEEKEVKKEKRSWSKLSSFTSGV